MQVISFPPQIQSSDVCPMSDRTSHSTFTRQTGAEFHGSHSLMAVAKTTEVTMIQCSLCFARRYRRHRRSYQYSLSADGPAIGIDIGEKWCQIISPRSSPDCFVAQRANWHRAEEAAHNRSSEISLFFKWVKAKQTTRPADVK